MTGDLGREFVDEQGTRWRAELVSHGRTSSYLAARVHRPLIQFSCLDRAATRRYAAVDLDRAGSLAALDEAELRELLGRSTPH